MAKELGESDSEYYERVFKDVYRTSMPKIVDKENY